MAKLADLYPQMAEYAATETQVDVLNLVLKVGFTAAARERGVGVRNIHDVCDRLVATCARRGFSPRHDMDKPVPQGYALKGTSTLYDEQGQAKAQWVKTTQDHEEQLKQVHEAVAAITESIPKAKKSKPLKKSPPEELLNLYIITDYHLGMKAWREETGDDWDLKIAEDLIYNWFDYAITAAPETHTGVFCQLGDFTHFDSLEAVTPTSKHLLDADTRAQLMVRVAIRVYRRIVQKLLTKHEHVHLIIADANHDPMGSIWTREWLEAHYLDEPRVTVDLGADGYYCYEHGKTCLFFHHGHKRRVTNVDDVFAGKFRDVFGRTAHAYAHMGHFHHKQVKETNLMVVEQHRTLAAKDAYASRGGYLAGRDAPVITYHKEYGQVGKLDISPEMVQ